MYVCQGYVAKNPGWVTTRELATAASTYAQWVSVDSVYDCTSPSHIILLWCVLLYKTYALRINAIKLHSKCPKQQIIVLTILQTTGIALIIIIMLLNFRRRYLLCVYIIIFTADKVESSDFFRRYCFDA